jgi:predicted homoserine dehydrogenase-like protein
MIIVDTALRKRAEEGRPIRVGMVGAGFMGSGLALQIAEAVPGMELCAIAARRPAQAAAAFGQTEDPSQIAYCETVSQIETSIASGRKVVTEDPAALASADGLDAIIETTGSMDFALSAVEAAIARSRHAILMNAELDGTVGPLLKARADRAGCIYSNVDGDQPGVQMNLIRFVRSIGVRPLLSGNIKGLQDPFRTPDTQRGFAEKWGQKPHMVTSFADGTKISFEQAIVANGTGMKVARRGMIGLDPTNRDPTAPLRPLEDFVPQLLPYLDPEGPGIVDYVVGARPGPGVFVIGHHPNPRQQHYLNLYKLGEGPFYLFYTPYHLCHFEAPLSIARAVLFADAALAPEGAPRVGVFAAAKRDLPVGCVLDGFGGYDTYGECDNADTMIADDLLPMALAEGCRMRRTATIGQPLRFSDVDLPGNRRIDEVYREQLAFFSSEDACPRSSVS